MLLLHLLALLLATVVFVVVNLSVVCTTAVAVAAIVTVMYPLWTHAITMAIAIDSVLMKMKSIILFGRAYTPKHLGGARTRCALKSLPHRS